MARLRPYTPLESGTAWRARDALVEAHADGAHLPDAAPAGEGARPGDPTREFSHPFIASHPSALAMYCSDGRFTHPIEALLAHLGFDRLDTVTVPGGPALLDPAGNEASEEVMRTATSFLVTSHHIEHVVLVAHENCGFYRARFPDLKQKAITARQLADLRAAAFWLHGAHPGVDVDLFRAEIRKDRTAFRRIPLEAPAYLVANDDDAQPIGPLTTELIVRGIRSGKVPPTALVREPDDERWWALGSIPALASALRALDA